MFFKKKPKEIVRKDWPFPEVENSATITTKQALEGHPILRVTHDEEGGWQMLCGTTNDPEDAKVVSLKSTYEKDPSLGDIADLPLGKGAYRKSVKHPWIRI